MGRGRFCLTDDVSVYMCSIITTHIHRDKNTGRYTCCEITATECCILLLSFMYNSKFLLLALHISSFALVKRRFQVF